MAGWYPGAEHILGIYNYTPGGIAKVGFCDHAAGGFYNTLRRADFWNSAGYSVHFGVARDGRVCQLVSIFDRAWGQGRLGPTVIWPPYGDMNFSNPNEYLISIEHEDWVLEGGVAKGVPGSQWTEAEYQATLAIKHWCIEQFSNLMRFNKESLASHHMFDSINRANCAGSYWRNEYRDRQWLEISGGGPQEDMFVIDTTDQYEIPGTAQLVAGQTGAFNIRPLLQLPSQYNDWDLEFSVIPGGDVTVWHGIPDAADRRAGRVRGMDQLVRCRLSDNSGGVWITCNKATPVWVAARGRHSPEATW